MRFVAAVLTGRLLAGDSLEVAQMRKLDSLIDLAKLTAGDNVLEIGCGWGSLAIRAVQVTLLYLLNWWEGNPPGGEGEPQRPLILGPPTITNIPSSAWHPAGGPRALLLLCTPAGCVRSQIRTSLSLPARIKLGALTSRCSLWSWCGTQCGSFAVTLNLPGLQTVGCKWTGVTLSKAQLKEAQGRVKAAGLDGRITLLFCDYRELAGTATFDKVISCEMIEAVGQEHLPTYFSTIGAMLRVGGTAVIQVCTHTRPSVPASVPGVQPSP